MVVKVSKPEINLREKLSEVDKPSGVAGQAMLAAETPQEQFNMIGAGRRNLLINASFDVSQRGNFNVSASGSAWTSPISAGRYGVDRWYAYGSGITTSTQVQQVYLPTGEEVKSLKCTATSTNAGSSFLHPAQQIEPQFWMEGKTFTLSAWVRTSLPGLKLRMCDTVSCFLLGDEIPGDGQWHYVTGIGTMGTNLNYSSSCQFQAAFGFGPVASGDYVEFAKPQIELGKVATPFEYRHYPEELALCQRYCYVIGHPSQVIYLGAGSMYTTTAVNLSVPLPVQLRHNSPSLTSVANGTGNWLNVYVGATGTVSNAAPLQGDYTQSNVRIYIPGAHSGSSPSAPGAGIWSMVLAGAQLIIDAEF
jgi:hypothetical protein